MQLTSLRPKIFIVGGDPETSHSTQTFLESQNCDVETIAYAVDFNWANDRLSRGIILLDLKSSGHQSFKVLNDFLFSDGRSSLILTTTPGSMLRPDDIFPGQRDKVLTHPVAPSDLLLAIKSFE